LICIHPCYPRNPRFDFSVIPFIRVIRGRLTESNGPTEHTKDTEGLMSSVSEFFRVHSHDSRATSFFVFIRVD